MRLDVDDLLHVHVFDLELYKDAQFDTAVDSHFRLKAALKAEQVQPGCLTNLRTSVRTWIADDEYAAAINTSRGRVIDETALHEALEAGRLGAAGLDVLAEEPPAPTHPLVRSPHVVLSPHSPAFTEEALAEVRKTVIRDALAVLSGGAPRHPVP